ncbi:uncharacterized protein LOC119584690 [Penaeus monodon]|uniref:uncharacterized protein LOC119584690 n=1 Tax=Penaeus monodon TaxID=6687 RepID=UPI0018A7BF51|nr:uncharacterized protein LOC119584690 [Penaeus monodon]
MVLPKREKQSKQPWMTTEILNLMKQRRKYKNRNSSKEYMEIHKLIKQECAKAKEELVNNKCEELEDLANKNQQLLIKKKIYAKVSWSQFGFRKEKGTRNAIFVIRILAERSIEMQKNLYVAFIDYEKAFESF